MITQTETLPDWEARFFAGIELVAAETRAKEAARAHETAATSYISSLEGQSRDSVIKARVTFKHSLRRLHATQRNLSKAQAECQRTNAVSSAQ
jgi:hypothetical protein